MRSLLLTLTAVLLLLFCVPLNAFTSSYYAVQKKPYGCSNGKFPSVSKHMMLKTTTSSQPIHITMKNAIHQAAAYISNNGISTTVKRILQYIASVIYSRAQQLMTYLSTRKAHVPTVSNSKSKNSDHSIDVHQKLTRSNQLSVGREYAAFKLRQIDKQMRQMHVSSETVATTNAKRNAKRNAESKYWPPRKASSYIAVTAITAADIQNLKRSYTIVSAPTSSPAPSPSIIASFKPVTSDTVRSSYSYNDKVRIISQNEPKVIGLWQLTEQRYLYDTNSSGNATYILSDTMYDNITLLASGKVDCALDGSKGVSWSCVGHEITINTMRGMAMIEYITESNSSKVTAIKAKRPPLSPGYDHLPTMVVYRGNFTDNCVIGHVYAMNTTATDRISNEDSNKAVMVGPFKMTRKYSYNTNHD